MASVTGFSPLSTLRIISVRRWAISSSSCFSRSHFGTVRDRCRRVLLEWAALLRSLIVSLLGQLDGLRRSLAQLHAQTVSRSGNAHLLVAQLPHDVKRLLRRLLLRQPQRVLLHRLFDHLAHV